MELGSLIIRVVADTKELMNGVQEAKNQMQGIRDFGGDMVNAGKKMTAAVTLPIIGLGAVAVDQASSLQESVSKTNAVYGESAAEILTWSQSTASSYGISQQAALEYNSTLGQIMQSQGVAREAAAMYSTDLVQLAADQASFSNTSPVEALNAIRAGLTGETEPLKRYGIVLRAAEVDQRALAMGMVDATGQVTEAGRVQARYQIIMEQSALAQGDFARTSEGLANQQRIMKAEIADAAANIGQQLLPLVNQAVLWFRGLIATFQGLSPETQKIILVVAGVAAVIGPLLIVVGALVSAFGAIIPVITAVVGFLSGPVLLVIGAVIAIVALLAAAWRNNWGGIQEKAAVARDFLVGVFQAIWERLQFAVDIFKIIFQAFAKAFDGDWRGFGEMLRMAWDAVWLKIGETFHAAWDALVRFFTETDWGELGRNIIKGVAEGIKNAAQWLIDAATDVVSAALDAAKGFLGIDSPSKVFEMQVGMQMGMGIREGFLASVSALSSDMSNIMGSLTPAAALSPAGLSAAPMASLGRVGQASPNNERTRSRENEMLVRQLRNLPDQIAQAVRDENLRRPRS